MYAKPQMHIDCLNYRPRRSHADWRSLRLFELLCSTPLRFIKHQLLPSQNNSKGLYEKPTGEIALCEVTKGTNTF